MDYSKYMKYFNREIKSYKQHEISEERIQEILDAVIKDIDKNIQNKKMNELALSLGFLMGVHLEENAKNKILNGEISAWVLIEKQIFWLAQAIKSVPNSGNVVDWELGGLIGLSLLWNHYDITELVTEYASKMFSKDPEYYSENKTHHVFMACLSHKWKTGEMPELFKILSLDNVYVRLMDNWHNSENLKELLYEVCDFHIYSASDTPQKSKEILSFAYIPYDYYCIKLLRDKEGLDTPNIEHPLLQNPLGQIPIDRPGYDPESDEILQYVLKNEKVPDWQRIIR
ncbi:hypothetical protein [Paenibacillus ehimensis]|uniref:hypothetical protein n=1 Tax=Paenibacillus ehimensis TaxID=79264 RepID=UPI00047208F3|nr:hypothetical protein [Paenibacillus ehimensis]